MKLDFKDLPNKFTPLVVFLKRYALFISIIAVLGIAVFFVLRISQYSRTEPTDQAVEEKLQTVQRPKIDQSVLNKIQQLQDQNVQVQALFDQARNNPFNE